MPTEYPPSATDRPTITVPNDGELASGGSLVGMRQLADITSYLKQQLAAAVAQVNATAALKAAYNVFTRGQTINAEDGWADGHLLTTEQIPGDDPTNLGGVGAPGSNKWKLVLGPFPTDRTTGPFPTAAPSAVGVYVGQGTKRFAITYNARWHVPTQKWRHLDVNRYAYAFVCRDSSFMVSNVPDHAAAWSDWPSTGELEAGVGPTWSAGYKYPPGTVISKAIDPLDFSGDGPSWSNEGQIVIYAPAMGAYYPLRVPHGAQLGQVAVKLQASGGDCNISIRLKRRGMPEWISSNVPSYPLYVGAGATPPTSHGEHQATYSPPNVADVLDPNLTFNNITAHKNESYGIYIQNKSGSPGSLYVHAIEFTYTDPGPRNH